LKKKKKKKSKKFWENQKKVHNGENQCSQVIREKIRKKAEKKFRKAPKIFIFCTHLSPIFENEDFFSAFY